MNIYVAVESTNLKGPGVRRTYHVFEDDESRELWLRADSRRRAATDCFPPSDAVVEWHAKPTRVDVTDELLACRTLGELLQAASDWVAEYGVQSKFKIDAGANNIDMEIIVLHGVPKTGDKT